MNVEELDFVFEFVIYLKVNDARDPSKVIVNETSCGWAKLPLAQAKTSMGNKELIVEGGSTIASITIDKEDHEEAAKRGGVFGALGIKGSSKSKLIVTTKQERQLEEDTKKHMELLPSTCLVHKRLLHFVTGFRSYAAHILLKDNNL